MNPATTALLMAPPLSQSKFELMACPHLYHSRIVIGIQEPENIYALRGTEIHEAIATYINHLVKTRQPSDYGYFERLLGAGYTAEALEILEEQKESMIIEPDHVLGTEIELFLDEELNPVEKLGTAWVRSDGIPTRGILIGPAFSGKPDLILVPEKFTAEIWDWKSYFQIIEADTFQSAFYPLLVFKHYPEIERVRFHLKFVRYGATRSVEYTRKDVPELEKMARHARQRQRAIHDHLDPTAMPGAHCGYCPKLMAGCPVKEINPYTNQAPADRVKFATWLAAAKKQNDQILKDLIKISGPVQITDGNGNKLEAGFQVQERSAYPAAKVYPILVSADPELAGKVTIGGLSTPLKAKKRAILAEKLAPLKTTKIQTRFGIRGADEEVEEDAD